MAEASTKAILHEIVARNQIHDALMRYCRGIDRMDRDLILSAYHPGARDNHGTFDGPVEEFIEWVIPRQAAIPYTTHFVGNELIEVDGDVARCESYMVAFYRIVVEGIEQDFMGFGRYVDRFELRDGAWRIAERITVFDKERIDPVPRAVSTLTDQLIRGARDANDPSYRVLRSDWPPRNP